MTLSLSYVQIRTELGHIWYTDRGVAAVWPIT
jgi:hypothetical protein